MSFVPNRDTLNNPEGRGFYLEDTEGDQAYEVIIKGIVVSDDGDPAGWDIYALLDAVVCHCSVRTARLVKAVPLSGAPAPKTNDQSLAAALFDAASIALSELTPTPTTPESSEDS